MPIPHTPPASLVLLREEHEGRVARVTLSAPPENTLDVTLLVELGRTLAALEASPAIACVVLDAAGPDFSTGLALGQRRAPYVEILLSHLHAAARRLASLDTLVLAKVRGRCTGAALELALLSHAILADGTARFGFPDLALGSFSPLAAVLLPDRIGRTRANELQLSGRTLAPDEATALGLVAEHAGGWDDLDSLGRRWIERHVLPRSTVALRAFARASRVHLPALLGARLDELEKLHLETVARAADAEEGISAALRGRPPRWQHR